MSAQTKAKDEQRSGVVSVNVGVVQKYKCVEQSRMCSKQNHRGHPLKSSWTKTPNQAIFLKKNSLPTSRHPDIPAMPSIRHCRKRGGPLWDPFMSLGAGRKKRHTCCVHVVKNGQGHATAGMERNSQVQATVHDVAPGCEQCGLGAGRCNALIFGHHSIGNVVSQSAPATSGR